MSKSYPEITNRISNNMQRLWQAMPDTMQGFSSMSQAATKAGVLGKKTKELMALAIGVATQCDGSIGFHTKALVELGATVEEVQEALAIAIYMGGGSAVMHAADVMLAFEQFSVTTKR